MRDDLLPPTSVEVPAAHAEAESFPRRVGRIRIEGRLGQGGMGVVYHGVDEALKRRVAIKAIRGRADDPARIRLRREAEMLSRLEHPNICRLHNLEFHQGADYLVLEFIEGRTLREVLRQEGKLPRENALAIAEAVAEVLDLAHRSGVVHRDLKASNIMLTENGEVKVLDFGIARAIDEATAPDGGEGQEDETPGLTRQGAIVGSLSTMSPEQARGEPATPASDMFSFGLLLQQLWTGEEPRTAETDQELLELAKRGGSQPVRGLSRDQARLVRRLKSKKAEMRPATREVLSEIRHMRGRRARWLWRGGLLLVILTLTVSAWKYTTDLRRERDRARVAEAQIHDEREATERVVEFLLGLFSSSDPFENRPPEETTILRGLIDEGAVAVDGLDQSPFAKIRVEQALAEVYVSLDEHDRARSLLRSGLETLDSGLHESPLLRAWSLQLWSNIERAGGDLQTAERLARESLATYETFPNADPSRLATVLNSLAIVVWMKEEYDEAERLLHRALDLRRQEGEALSVIPLLLNLGILRRNANDLDGATALMEEALALAEAGLRPDHGRIGGALSSLATTYHLQGRNDEALPLFQRALEIKEARLGRNHSSVSASLSNLANVYRELERFDEAEASARRGVEIDRATRENHSETSVGLQILAIILDLQGEHAEAEALLIEAVEIADHALGVQSLGASSARRFLADHWVEVEEHEAAEATYREIIETYSRLEDKSSWRVGEIEAELASFLAAQGDRTEAQELIESALLKVTKTLGEDHPLVAKLEAKRAEILAAKETPDTSTPRSGSS